MVFVCLCVRLFSQCCLVVCLLAMLCVFACLFVCFFAVAQLFVYLLRERLFVRACGLCVWLFVRLIVCWFCWLMRSFTHYLLLCAAALRAACV